MKEMLQRTVEKIKEHNYCIGCGMCETFCPVSAITINFSHEKGQFLPLINYSRCTKCGICLAVCPGDDLNHPVLHQSVHQKQPEDPFIGSYLQIYKGFSKNEEYRKSGASGGFVTQFLANLLESKAVDAVLVCAMEDGNIHEPHSYLVKRVEDLGRYQRSVYTNVHWAKVIDEVRTEKLRTAIVGLPCHIHSLVKAIALKPELREYFRFTIGLFCGGTYNFNAISKTLSDMKISDIDVARIDFRWGQWPGKLRILQKNGVEHLTKRGHHFRTNYLSRCYFCFDFLADLADVSVGDNWMKGNKSAENVIIVRKKKVLNYLENLELEEISAEDIHVSHKLKSNPHRFSEANCKVGNFFSRQAPNIIPYSGIKPKAKHYFSALLEYYQFSLGDSSDEYKRAFLKFKDIYFHFVMGRESRPKK
ncbi:MAG: Coenzyme F420 hydrogenase/dehydrogenase, beta subunit C-terminal domain [Candidatus Zophobacter franzmannii]|nr:Coenzyme F420 hydrogenase/dehydrogenase, beta subunit C-terminal domain [Candidatus Zophobacter franzmannii]